MRIILKFAQESNTWDEIKFEELKDGDIFKILDDGEPLTDRDGNESWTAKGEPYYSENHILTIQTN